MIESLTIDLTTLLSPEQLAQLQAVAADQQTDIAHVIHAAIDAYLQDDSDDDDTPVEVIEAKLRSSLGQALRGETRPIEALFAEVDGEMVVNAHED